MPVVSIRKPPAGAWCTVLLSSQVKGLQICVPRASNQSPFSLVHLTLERKIVLRIASQKGLASLDGSLRFLVRCVSPIERAKSDPGLKCLK